MQPTKLERARNVGYTAHKNATALQADQNFQNVWFDECETEDKTYAYSYGSQFEVDLIGQSYQTQWTIDRIQELFDLLEPLCGPKYSLHCGGIVVRVKGIAPGNVPDVARIVLDAVTSHRVPRGQGSGFATKFTRTMTPANYEAKFSYPGKESR